MNTLESYDQVPYEGYAVAESHPDRLAIIAALFGLSPAPADDCRVLELGAAAGGNLIPMAFNLPGSRFTGVELSQAQARQGQAMITGLGLDNARMLHRDILDLPDDPREGLGSFDYILAHGVWSWAPRPVREKILALCAGLLAPGGVAYLSYNVRPGWHQRAMLRDMLLHATREAATAVERLALARAFLGRLAAGLSGDQRPEAQVQMREIAYLQGARDSYLFHEYLEETNEAELFADFLAAAKSAGLQYLGDADLYTMFHSGVGPGAIEVLDAIETLSETEQIYDFLSLRPFRRSLLVRAEERIERDIDLGRLLGLRAYADLQPDGPPGRVTGTQVYRSPGGGSFEVTHQLTKAVLTRLDGVYPNAEPLGDTLEAAARDLSNGGDNPEAVGIARVIGELFSLYCSGGLGLSSLVALRRSNQPGARPRATRLARAQAASGEGHAASLRHRVVMLDRLSERLLILMDGARDIDALTREILAAIESERGIADPSACEAPIEDVHPSAIRASVERLLRLFARNGMLEED